MTKENEMKNNSELNEFIEQLGEALDMDIYCPIDATEAQRQAHGYRYKAARILHEMATNPKYEDMNARDALDDLIGGV